MQVSKSQQTLLLATFIKYREDLNNELVRYLIHGDYHLPGI